jgi:hypothetical protein
MNSIIKFVSTAVVFVVEAVVTMFDRVVDRVVDFFCVTKAVTAAATRGDFGFAGYFALALFAALLAYFGLFPALIVMFKIALVYASVMYLLDCLGVTELLADKCIKACRAAAV